MTPERRRQIDELLQSVLELRPDERTAYLDRVCEGDTALRLEVDSILSNYQEDDDFLEKPVVQFAAEMITADAIAGVRFSEESLINGRYRIERILGWGGFSRVYLARDEKVPGNPQVAIKILVSQMEDDRARKWVEEKFKGEIEAIAKIEHPGVVRPLDVGVLNEGNPFFVMQYVLGQSLRSLMKREPIALERIGKIIKRTAAALDVVHAQGVIHRDLKPENIMLQSTGDEELPILIDFGIAVVRETVNKAAHITRAAGTIGYMAPEQIQGRPVFQSDIYSLGVIAYEMITGRLPFDADFEFQLMELQRAAAFEDPGKLRPDLPQGVAPVIRQALSFASSERYDGAGRFADALEHALNHKQELIGSLRPRETRQQKIVNTRGGAKRLAIFLTALISAAALFLATSSFLSWPRPLASYFGKTIAEPALRPEAEILPLLKSELQPWVDRLFRAQADNGGIKEQPSSSTATASAWTTAQCMKGVLSAPVNIEVYIPKIKSAFAFIESTRRRFPEDGWNLYGDDDPHAITEIASWIALAYIASVEARPKIWTEAERPIILQRIERDLAHIIKRQDLTGGWSPISNKNPDFTRTYSTAMALWSLIEAKRSPVVNERIGNRYDENVSRGVNWLLQKYNSNLGWSQNPNRSGQVSRFDGLTAQVLFVLSRAESLEELRWLSSDHTYRVSQSDFAKLESLANRSIKTDNSSVPDPDQRFTGTGFKAEGSTFLWFPWSFVELVTLSTGKQVPPDVQKSATELRLKILNLNLKNLGDYMESEELMYWFAENLFCISYGLDPNRYAPNP